MKRVLLVLALIAVAIVLPFFLPGIGKQAGVDPQVNLPWQIELDGQGGSRVFGIRPGQSLLGEVKAGLGEDRQVAIVAAPNEVGALEVYYNQVALGFVMARVILAVDAPDGLLQAMRERAPKAEFMESATRKISLHPDDLVVADRLPVRSISVIPTVNLDVATVIQRFGEPGERLAVGDKRVHLLYPEKGLDVVVDEAGKELLQYVAPRDFARLRDPLLK